MPLPLTPLSTLHALIHFPMSGHAPQTGSHGVSDLRTKAKIWEEERGEQWALRVGFSPWWSGEGPQGLQRCWMPLLFQTQAVCGNGVSDHGDCPV